MKKLYATLFSALVVGCAVCAGCTTKKVSSSAEVVDIIHKGNLERMMQERAFSHLTE